MKKTAFSDVSRLFVWGFAGSRLTPALKRSLRQFPPAGLILFRRNIESIRQLRKLIAAIRSSCPQPLWIGIDEEGGRVRRLPEPFPAFPAAREWGNFYRQGVRDAEFYRRIGRSMGLLLKRIGINLNFAPVLDVHSNPKNPVIGDRAFATRPEIVCQTAISFGLGLLDAGILPCGKHFPGHGDTFQDSHRVLPVSRNLGLLPFQAAIRAGLPALMTAHVVYPTVDPFFPATLSPMFLQGLLRKKLRFRGVVFSDDLQMKAIADRYPLSEATLATFSAGCDLLLICKNFETGGDIVRSLARQIAADRYLKTRFLESLGRIDRIRKKYLK